MPRTARLNYPGGTFHLISRCVAGHHLINDDETRGYYLNLLGRVLNRTDTKVLAWCLMSTHTHLVVVQGRESLQRLTKPLHTGLARYINDRRRGRGPHGSVFADRPRAILVDSDAYLLELIRYVHNNPVRANLVRHAGQSGWSSHRAYIGKTGSPEWLAAGFVLDQFGKRAAIARKRFEDFVRDGEREQRRAEFAGDLLVEGQASVRHVLGDSWRVSDTVVGDDAFCARVRRDVERVQAAFSGGALSKEGSLPASLRPAPRRVVEAVQAQLDLEPWEFEEQAKAPTNVLARRLMTWVWVRRIGGTQAQLARELRVASSLVSRWYGAAVRAGADLEPLADAVMQQLGLTASRGAKRPGRRVVRTQTTRISFQVLVDE